MFVLPAGYAKRPRKAVVKRSHPEQSLQTRVAGYLSWALAPPAFFTAVGHGGGGALRGAILKGMGLKAGVPDILIIHKGRCIFIELKANKGKLSPEQILVHQLLTVAGAITTVCRSLDEVRMKLELWDIPLRDEKPSAQRLREAGERLLP